MKKQIKYQEEDNRISQLPQPLLHHILCYLSQKEAVQTCVLSKSWRHLGPTRPKVDFREKFFNKKEAFLSVLNKTLQRYQDQKLSIEFFRFETESEPLLGLSVPIVMLNMGVKTFTLSVLPKKKSSSAPYFDPPSEVFRDQTLYLERCKLSQTNYVPNNVVFKNLQTLRLRYVEIDDETFEKIMSCCPSIEDVRLDYCVGLKTIKVTATDKLKRFVFKEYENYEEDEETCGIKIDYVQTMERITITWGCPFWFQQHCQKNFMHLKVLCLGLMRLSTETIGTFSHNFPCLEDLTLNACYGFKEMKLSSCSIERLTLSSMREYLKVTIHAPNILYFKYESYFLPSSFSFTTASGRHGWKSDLWLTEVCFEDSSGFFRLNEVLRALSQSEISLELCISWFSGEIEDTSKGGLIERVVVEHLVLRGDELFKIPRSLISSFFSLFFRVCCPRNIEPLGFCAIEGEEDEQLTWLLCEFLLQKRKGRETSFSQREDLEEVKMELRDDSKDEWLFRLKWKESASL